VSFAPIAVNLRALRRWSWLIFAAAALFLFLGTRGLNEPDEGRYAEIGREMVVTGEWLVPHLNGFEHFQKPPLLYWATASSIRLFGVNEWAARLPSALAAFGTLMLTFAIARRLFDETRAVAAAVILLTSVEFFLLGRLLTPDMLLTFWTTAAIAALVYRRPWLFFVCIGLGFLTKGPMALIVPISAAIGWQLATPAADRVRLPWLRGLPIALAIGLSWFVVLSLWRADLFEYFWRYELVDRFASRTHGRSKPFWFFAPVLLAGFLPWVFWMPGVVRVAWRRCRDVTLSAPHGLLLGWTLPPLLILSLSGSKLPTYVLPLLPALAIAVAVRLRAPQQVWRVALPTTACLLAASAFAPRFESALGQQASVRSLAGLLSEQPDLAGARIFACEVRAHGFEFYTGRLVSMTKHDADIVLRTSPAQAARLFNSPEDIAKELAGTRAFGLVRTKRFAQTFTWRGWTVLGQSGDFLLIRNSPMEGLTKLPSPASPTSQAHAPPEDSPP
jgi:4-amino-4-deoxy-L-arabinose transferase-like glycosyltransferase